MKLRRIGGIVLFCCGVLALVPLRAFAAGQTQAVKQAVEQGLAAQTRFSGTLDLYDAGANRVRNLRFLKFESVAKTDKGYEAHLKYGDVKSGDIVQVAVPVTEENGTWALGKVRVASVEPGQNAGKTQAKYSDADILQAMRDYIQQQSKFTKCLMLFDPTAQKMRKLVLLSLDNHVRHLGMLDIATAEFKDLASGEHVRVDITVENKNGRLKVQAMHIRNVVQP